MQNFTLDEKLNIMTLKEFIRLFDKDKAVAPLFVALDLNAQSFYYSGKKIA